MTVTRPARIVALASACALSLSSLAGCSINKMVADQTASLINEGSPALDNYFDYDLAGIGIPGAIMQLEAFLHVTPNNEELSLTLAKAYVGYAQGWVENEAEVAFAAGDMDKSDRLRQRARYLYLRGRNLALHSMRVRDDGIDEALKSGDASVVAKYVAENYTSKEDTGPLFWSAIAWGAAIAVSLDQPDLIADLPVVKPLMERARELDDSYFNYGAYIFLGTVEAALPQALGGNPEKGREWYEQGLEKTGRKNHMLQVMYARIYAVNTSNRDLFYQLLTEVIEAPDLGHGVRLSNKVARVRAARYLGQAKEWF